MIFVGIDDTDTADSRGTNQLARALAAELDGSFRCLRIVRHQLLDDPRVPYTSKNGSASLLLEPRGQVPLGDLILRLRQQMLASHIEGSDPGLCVTEDVPPDVIEFGRRCQTDFVSQRDARRIATDQGFYLEGLGGTEDGVIGALAAVGLAATHDDGRIVHRDPWPDDLCGVYSVAFLNGRGVEVRRHGSGQPIRAGLVDVGKRLRPNRRQGSDVLFVKQDQADPQVDQFIAVKVT